MIQFRRADMPQAARAWDWRLASFPTTVSLNAPAIGAIGALADFGQVFVLSLAGHEHNRHLLLAKSKVLLADVMRCCALVSYAADSPVCIDPFSETKGIKDEVAVAEGLKQTPVSSLSDYCMAVGLTAEAANDHAVPLRNGVLSEQRVLTRWSPKPGRQWCQYPWPQSDRVWRALFCYWTASLSVMAPSRLLNFWRAIEAVSAPERALDKVAILLGGLSGHRVAPVWTRAWLADGSTKTVNWALSLKRKAIQRADVLTRRDGSVESAVKRIYCTDRGKSAHADKISVEFDLAQELGEQFRTAELLRFLARVAIESAWQAEI